MTHNKSLEAEVQDAIGSIESARSGGLNDHGEDPHEWRRQTVADLIGLPNVCVHRRCHRKRRCRMPGVPCIDLHRATVTRRLSKLLGFDDGELSWGDDDDF